uniref:Uncharacterized protein n=1 Tax=Caenorhabditis japonica TaxID=281687 RepID=A0A8R1E7L5_CAEJA
MDEILVSLPNVAFDLAAARQMDRIVYFPGGFPVLITDHITAKMNSEFVLTEKEDVISTIANTIRRILHQLHSKDNYFPMYTTPTAHQKKVHYVPIQEEVFDHFASTIFISDSPIRKGISDILITGYSLENNDKIKTKVFAVLQNTVYYFLERLRAEFNKNTERSLALRRHAISQRPF